MLRVKIPTTKITYTHRDSADSNFGMGDQKGFTMFWPLHVWVFLVFQNWKMWHLCPSRFERSRRPQVGTPNPQDIVHICLLVENSTPVRLQAASQREEIRRFWKARRLWNRNRKIQENWRFTKFSKLNTWKLTQDPTLEMGSRTIFKQASAPF